MMIHKRMRRRSSASLMVSGAATINVAQSLRPRRLLSPEEALRRDREAISEDRRNAMRDWGHALESA